MKTSLLRSIFAGSLLVLGAAGMASAQSGMAGGQDGLHQIGANTLGQWNVSFGLGGNASLDCWSMAAGGEMHDKNGDRFVLNDEAVALSGNVNLAMGFTNWLDLGVVLPFNMDIVGDHEDRLSDSDMRSPGLGDLEAWFKVRAVGNDESLFKLAILGQLYAPTGSEDAGVRPRHAWYLSKHDTKPYTAGDFAFGGGLVFTFDFNSVGAPLRWNTQASYIRVVDHNESDVLSYSTGFNFSPISLLDIFLELSGEMHLDDDVAPIDPTVDPLLITPGVRFHAGKNMDIALGVDIAGRMFKNLDFTADKDLKGKEGFDVRNDVGDGEVYTYKYSSTPIVSGSLSFVWRFGSKVDKPEVNVDSLIQVRADSLAKVKVDSIMATIDTTT